MAYVHLVIDDLLGALLSAELPADEKLRIMETEFSILADDRMRGDVSTMCNLSQGILAREIIEKKEHALA